MTRTRPALTPPLLVLAAAAALAWSVRDDFGAAASGTEALPAPPAAETDAKAAPGPSFALSPIEAYAEIAARNLFSPTRRPAGPAAAPAGEAATALRLVGVVAADAGRVALIADGAGPAARLGEGDAVAGWKVARIAPSEVVLRRGAAEMRLALAFQTSSAGPSEGEPIQTD